MSTHDIAFEGREGITLWYGDGVDLDMLGQESKKPNYDALEKKRASALWRFVAASLAVYSTMCGLVGVCMLFK